MEKNMRNILIARAVGMAVAAGVAALWSSYWYNKQTKVVPVESNPLFWEPVKVEDLTDNEAILNWSSEGGSQMDVLNDMLEEGR